ncbi:hypothetical protein Acsp04_47620 [Actinomadura sp. NBRC 104425]|nr:hypothetical protein Acsp04_47620 [Actinomadura sp. NBRC 104425]
MVAWRARRHSDRFQGKPRTGGKFADGSAAPGVVEKAGFPGAHRASAALLR